MKSIRRGQHLITIMLLLFLLMFSVLIYRLQTKAAFYISHASDMSLGKVYDRKGEVLFDPKATAGEYGADYFLDVGNLIGDDSRQMTNTLVSQNRERLANFSFMLGEQPDGQAAICTTLDHTVNRRVYDRFGWKNGCAVAYNYVTGEIYVCLSKPSVNILDHYENIENLEDGSLLCKVFYPTVPGSTQKIATTLAALEHMGYEDLMSKRFTCEGAYENLGEEIIKCHKDAGHGEQDINDAFANSCNPWFAQLVEDPDWRLSDIKETYRSMGYNVNGEDEPKTIDVNGISAFTASTSLTDKTDFNTQWGCMGQGTTLVSPLQLMVWQSAIANQTGVVTLPHLIDHTVSVSGKESAQTTPAYGTHRMFSPDNAAHMREIMRYNGINRYADLLPGAEVAVKSGTAQIGNDKTENSLLTGFVDDPNFPIAFCIVIENRVSGEISTTQIAATMLQELKSALDY